MKDAQNLAKLLGHLPPKVFRTFVHEEFNVTLPKLDQDDGKRKQHAQLTEALNTLPVPNRQRMEEVAEKIVLLCDAPGQDAMDGIQEDIFDDEDRKAFDKLANQYERSLWLYRNEPDLFHRALDWRQADYLHQSQTCYDGFVAPKDLTVLEDADAVAEFHRKLAAQRGCDVKDIAVQGFFDVSYGFQNLPRRAGDQVDHGHEGLGIAVAPGSCACVRRVCKALRTGSSKWAPPTSSEA